jgi:hypothetical protein
LTFNENVEDSTLWSITIDSENNVDISHDSYTIKYNSGSSPRFSQYTSSQNDIQLFVLDNNAVSNKTLQDKANEIATAACTTKFDSVYSSDKDIVVATGFTPVIIKGESAVTIDSENPQKVIIKQGSDPVEVEIELTSTIEYHGKFGKVTVEFTVASASAVSYSKYTGNTIVEGDYVIYYNGNALKNTISSNRATNEAVVVSDNSISGPSDEIVWHIAANGDYWTIYNASVGKYLASTATKNQARLIDTVTDNALWTITITDGKVEIVNKASTASSINANLRNNGTNGWACYSSSTGGALTLYKK